MQALLERTRDLLHAVEGLRALHDPGDDPRTNALLLLKTKAIPELEAGLDLPIFVGVQGGTNVGKSTIFNALAGKILSPSLVVASATKHPLVFAHARWRARFLEQLVFPGLECRELEDPKELITGAERADVLYFRFHDDGRLSNAALIDSPDFDSALETNAEGAAKTAAISDVTLFVTTAQKYKDRVLVDQLRRLLGLKEGVVLIFNMVEEPIVFETLLDDLRAELGEDAERLRAVRVPPSRARHPEDEIREALLPPLLDRLEGLDAARLKPAVLVNTLRRALELSARVVERYSTEAAFQKEVKKLAAGAAEECAQGYRRGFQLALPEETLAIRRILGVTELGPYLSLSPAVEKSSKVLGLVGSSIRRLNDMLRRVMIRLSRSDEGTLEPGEAALEEYARARDQADTESVLRLLEPLRIKVESFVRGREDVSALARELLRAHLTPQRATGFAAAAREAHAGALRAARDSAKGTGEEILPGVEKWIAGNRAKVKAIAFLAIAFKLGAGLGLAWALPPSEGVFAVFQPLKWLYFAAGYMGAAYVIALLASWRIRRRVRFQRAREEVMETAMRMVFLDPLEHALDDLLAEKDLKRISKASREIKARLDETVAGTAAR